MKLKLTKTAVDRIQPEQADVWAWDTEVRGFGLRVKPSGTKTYIVQYRNAAGATRRMALGQHGQLTAEQARAEAQKRIGSVKQGRDPSAEKSALRAAPSVNDLVDYYLGEYAKQRDNTPGYIADTRKMLDRFVTRSLGTRKAADVTKADIRRLHASLKATPYQANRLLAALNKLFVLGVDEFGVPSNPCGDLSKFREEKRERFLSSAEIRNLFELMAAHPNQACANAVRLLLLTGARKNELLRATWDMFDLEQGLWIKPSHHTKQKKEHRVPLSAPVLEILRGMQATRDSGTPFLFPGRKLPGRDEVSPLEDIRRFWDSIREAAGIEELRVHDLRHSAASLQVSAGVPLHVVGKTLGHTQAKTTERYAHVSDNAAAQAMDRLGELVGGIAKGEVAEVVPIRRRTG